MPATFQPIEAKTLASTAASVVFSSIPQTYTDLILVFETQLSTSNAIKVQYNSNTSSIYSYTRLYGIGSGSGSSDRASNATYFDAGFSASNRVNQIINIMDYSNTTTNKTALSRAITEGGTQVFANVWLWRSTNAITSIDIAGVTGNLASGSTFSLYGVKAG